jgi:putative ABC transport system permease protein
MSVDLLERPAPAEAGTGTGNGGVPARRAMVRWAWRLFRREWRQQFLILALIIVAVAATFVGAAVATNAPAPAKAGFGTAGALATFQNSGKQANAPLTATQATADIAQVQHRFGRVDVIENETFAIPGSVDTYSLRAQNPRGAFGQPMLSLVSGHYPSGPGQVALTQGLASTFNVRAGDTWHGAGQSWQVVGIVQNPQSLLDEFALVAPGQVTSPSQVSVLFNAPGVDVTRLGHNYQTPQSASSGNVFNPETIVFAVATVGMLLIALVAVGGFTVLAQRRLRSIGMLGALGATDRNIKLVVKANGAVVGVVGTFLGAALGLVAWLLYRPHAESSSHHLIGVFTLPWAVIIPSMIVAIVATYLAASRPARSITKVPIVTALSGRPAPPRQIHRSAIPGVLVMVLAILLLSYAGTMRGGGGAPEVIFGLVSLIVALILLSPLSLTALAKVTRRTPIAVRLAVRDLARYRARSGSALSAISLGVLIAVLVCVLAAARYGNVLDYAGPNLASNKLVVYPPNSGPGQGGPGGGSPSTPTPSVQAMAQSAHNLGASLGTQDVVALVATDANLEHAANGRQFGGQVYVATPALLKAFGIAPSQVDPKADVLSMRPGLSTLSLMQLQYGNGGGPNLAPTNIVPGQGPVGPGPGGPNAFSCSPGSCVANPDIQEVSALPSGTSAPNTLITEHAVHQLHLSTQTAGWLIQTAQPITATQITNARQAAAAAGLTLESKNSQPSSSEITNWATVFGLVLALGILAMTLGLIRSETAGDLRILSATGASSYTRRAITAATAGALGLLGALVGTVAAYVAAIAYSNSNANDGLSSLINSIPVRNLLVILVVMPLIAVVVGWLLAGRQPPAISQQPVE